jgi:hypothetical protein
VSRARSGVVIAYHAAALAGWCRGCRALHLVVARCSDKMSWAETNGVLRIVVAVVDLISETGRELVSVLAWII